ncbi:MAG: hypothetical protein ACFE9T_10645 [Promethearchaeota archaeon]
MKKYTKFVIFCLISLIAMSALIPITRGDSTTIEDSTFPASDGEYYKWTCTYCNDSFDVYIGEGSYFNVTIGTIYQGSYMAISHALIVPAIAGTYYKGVDSHSSDIVSYYCVYNASLHYIYLPFNLAPPFILPIPLNLTMIAEHFISNWGAPTTISGNSLIVDVGSGSIQTFNYNSNGFCTSYTLDIYGEQVLKYSLGEGEGDGAIPYGEYFIVPTVITIGIIVIFIKKRYSIN